MTALPPTLTLAAAPRFAAHVRLHFDKVRCRWVVLAGENCFVLDDVAAEILSLCDGSRSIGAIIAERLRLEDEAAGDALAILQDLLEKGVLAA